MVFSNENLTVFSFYFLAVGCPDIEGIENALIERTETTAIVKCPATQETWHLVCRDNAWVGEIKNCSAQALEGTQH